MKFYIPLLYTEKVKKPDKRYFLRTIIGEDFAIFFLTFSYNNIHFWKTAVVLFLLQVSFWCVYEIGYIENDIVAKNFEDRPVISRHYKFSQYLSSPWQPWVWSFILSAIAIFIIHSSIENSISLMPLNLDSARSSNIAKSYLSWIAFLAILRFIFNVYNHLNKQSRVWFYSLLQTCRYGGYSILLTVSPVGLILLSSIIVTRWIQYIIYRYKGGQRNNWPVTFPRYFFCFIIFILSTAFTAINERDLSFILNYQALAIALFCFVRGYKHFNKVFLQFVSVNKDGSNNIS